MRYIGFRMLVGRIKAISAMMKDREVPFRKKLLIIAGIIYLFLPLYLIPPILGPFGFIDDIGLWLWIIWHLKDTYISIGRGRLNVICRRTLKERIL